MSIYTTAAATVRRGAVEILLDKELEQQLSSGRTLTVKAGFDPTAPDLHLGHTVLLNKMRQLQDLGHQVVVVIGDFTALIGDPSGKNITRPPLRSSEIATNAKTYTKQIFKILLPEKTKVLFNSAWLQQFTLKDTIELAAIYTVARMLERDDFNNRYRANKPIAIHEFLYPLLQGYDSVVLKADIELGGNDQKFNLLIGRELQKHFGQVPQTVLLMPLLEGLDGVQKMSKSLGNYIGITEPAVEIFGKIMSVSDQLMWRYFELLSFRPLEEIAQFQKEVQAGANPRDFKLKLAGELVARFHSRAAALQAEEEFIARFQQGAVPQHLAPLMVSITTAEILVGTLLKQAGLVASTSEALRLIAQGAVKIDGQRVTSRTVTIAKGSTNIYQIGKKRVAKIEVI